MLLWGVPSCIKKWIGDGHRMYFNFPVVCTKSNYSTCQKIVQLSFTRCTVCGHRMAHRKWRETKLHPGTAGPGSMLGCCLISFHFLLANLCPQTVGGERNVENAFLFLMRAASNSQWIPRSSLGSSCSVFHLFTVVLSPYSLSASESPFRRLPLHVPSGELTATELYKTFSKKLIWIELISALCVPQVTKRDATFEIKFTQPRATP